MRGGGRFGKRLLTFSACRLGHSGRLATTRPPRCPKEFAPGERSPKRWLWVFHATERPQKDGLGSLSRDRASNLTKNGSGSLPREFLPRQRIYALCRSVGTVRPSSPWPSNCKSFLLTVIEAAAALKVILKDYGTRRVPQGVGVDGVLQLIGYQRQAPCSLFFIPSHDRESAKAAERKEQRQQHQHQ